MRAGSAAIRPWGPAPWLFDRLPRRWSLLGCLGAEERSLGILELLQGRASLQSGLLAEIRPIASSRFFDVTEQRLKDRRNDLALFGKVVDSKQMELFCSDQEIVSVADDFVASASPHVVLDVSALPKRFFFPFLKRLLRSKRTETIVATYTVPEQYGTGDLAEDHQPFTHLPLFGTASFPVRKPEKVIVSAGYMKLGLAELLEPYKEIVIRTILPFPPGPPSYFRNWDFIRDIEKALPKGLHEPIRIEAYDCVDAFEHIKSLCDSGKQASILAPFGPKPISLAMALYAELTGDVVLYTQPTVYDPYYSRGISRIDGLVDSHAYLIRANGRNKYQL
jgi:hypothetical protein